MVITKRWAKHLIFAPTITLVCSSFAFSFFTFNSRLAHASGGGFNKP